MIYAGKLNKGAKIMKNLKFIAIFKTSSALVINFIRELPKIINTIEKIIAVKADQLAHNKIDLLKKTMFFFP